MAIKEINTKDEFFNELKAQTSEIRKQEFLENLLKRNIPPEVRIAVFISLADFYIKKKWFGMAAKQYTNAADLANTFNEKTDYYFKGGVLFLNGGEFIDADNNFRKVLVLSATKDKNNVRKKIVSAYKENVDNYEKTRQYTKGIAIINKMLSLNLPMHESGPLYDRLASLYEKIGQPGEANRIKNFKIREEERQKEKENQLEEYY